MDVCLRSLGCRVNQAEVEALGFQLAKAGHTIVDDVAEADLCILNTCAVTAQAERKTRRRVGSLARSNPSAAVAVIGCYATLAPEACAALPGVAYVASNGDKERLVATLTGAPQSPSPSSPRIGAAGMPGYLRTRAFVKVQDGCDNRCTYCITRLLRGPARSRPLAGAVSDVHRLAAAGFQEVVLTGVNLGSYGRDLRLPDGLRTLVQTVLAHTDVSRLRLSSLEPWDLDEGFFDLWEDPRLCRQIHLPLQAGCDDTLRRMGRPTTCAAFARLVGSARARIPDLAVTTDVIAGFPGETERAFHTSFEFVASMGFARSHVFPYSPRPGTAAASLPDQLPRDARQARARALRDLGAEQLTRFCQQFVGREMPVLWERRRRDGLWSGLTDNYLRVVAHAECNLHNRLAPVRLVAARDGCLVGRLLDEPTLGTAGTGRIPHRYEERYNAGSRSYDA